MVVSYRKRGGLKEGNKRYRMGRLHMPRQAAMVALREKALILTWFCLKGSTLNGSKGLDEWRCMGMGVYRHRSRLLMPVGGRRRVYCVSLCPGIDE
jgi:hypothetical protein